MKEFQDNMVIYRSEHRQMKELLREFDQAILTKAGKAEYFELRNELETKITKKEMGVNN